MNILLLTQFFSTTRGGGEHIFSLIAKNLAEKGHNVFVITNKIIDEDYKVHKNVQLIFVAPTLQYKGGLPPGFVDNARYAINAIRAGLKVIKKEKIDVVHSNNFAPSLAGSILSSLTSAPHIIAIHDVFSLCGRNYWKQWGIQSNVSRINVALAPFFEKLMVKIRHDCIHTVSEATRDDLIQFGARDPIHIIYNAIENRSQEKQIEIDPLRFVHVGRLVFYKNLEVIIKAISIAKKKEPRIKLSIVGDGPYRKTLEKLVKSLGLESNVEFIGYVTSNEKMEMIASSNALVFPSLCEGFGLVILEAFSQSRPVLVSNVRPMSSIVSHGTTGYVLDSHDDAIWAEYLLRMSSNLQESSIMGKNGNKTLDSLYSEQLMSQKIIEMYSNAIKARQDTE